MNTGDLSIEEALGYDPKELESMERCDSEYENREGEDMKVEPDGQVSGFSTGHELYDEVKGISIRAYMATHILAGMDHEEKCSMSYSEEAHIAVIYADALIEELNK